MEMLVYVDTFSYKQVGQLTTNTLEKEFSKFH